MNWHAINSENFMQKLNGKRLNKKIFSWAVTSHVCDKEIQESLDYVDRIRDVIKNKRVLELCGGHGLVGLILIEKRYARSVHLVDKNDTRAHRDLESHFKRWNQATFDQCDLIEFLRNCNPKSYDVVVGMHLCGALTDIAIKFAMENNLEIVVTPCCYHKLRNTKVKSIASCFAKLRPVDIRNSVDIVRGTQISDAGLKLKVRYLNESISPMNTILIGER